MNTKIENKLLESVSPFIGSKLISTKFIEKIINKKKVLVIEMEFDNKEILVFALDTEIATSDSKKIYEKLVS